MTGFGMLVFFTDLNSYGISGQIFGLMSSLFSVIEGFKWFWMGSLLNNIQLMLELLKAHPFLVLHSSYYNSNDILDDVICNIAINADDTTLFLV